MTLQEVSEHFKNAKFVRCLNTDKVEEIDTGTMRLTPSYKDVVCYTPDKGIVVLYTYSVNQFADILQSKQIELPNEIELSPGKSIHITNVDGNPITITLPKGSTINSIE